MSFGRSVPALTVVALAAVTVAAGVQEQRYRLRLTDRVGSVNRYRLEFDMQMRAEYTGAEGMEGAARRLMETLDPGMSVRTSLEYERRLEEVSEDGTRTFEVRWHDYEFDGRVGDRPIPRPDGHRTSTERLLSRPARVHTSPTGRTLGVEHGHPDLARLGQRFQQGMPTYLPEQPVAVGDRWTSVVELPVGLPMGQATMNLEMEHRLVEVREGPAGPIAVIELTGSYSQLQELGVGRDVPPLHMEASLRGTTDFEIDHGRFASGRYELDMFAVQSARGVDVELTGYATGTLKLLENR